jgi:hypothetical protein
MIGGSLRSSNHIIRDIDVFSAFPLAALLGATMEKALKTSISRNI